MSTIANRRELAESVQLLVKTNKPDAALYDRVLTALSAVATDHIGCPVKAVFAISKAELAKVNAA